MDEGRGSRLIALVAKRRYESMLGFSLCLLCLYVGLGLGFSVVFEEMDSSMFEFATMLSRLFVIV